MSHIQIGTAGWHCLSSWKSWRTKSRVSSVWSRVRRARMLVCWVLYILCIWWYSVTFGVFAHFQIYRTAVTISAMPHSRQAPQNENESDRKCFYQAFPIQIPKIYIQGVFFNWSARFSVPKWNNLLSQRGAFLYWKFREKLVLVGCNLFFILVLKMGRNS